MLGQRPGDRALARGGGSVDGDDHVRPNSFCRLASNSKKPGKLVATGATSSMVMRLAGDESSHRHAHRDAVIELRGDLSRRRGSARRRCPSMTSPSSNSSTVAPIARSPSAIAAMRSDSLTRNSCAPARPCAPAPTRRRRTGSDIRRSCSARARVGTSIAGERRMAHDQIGDRLAADGARIDLGDVGAHHAQRRRTARRGSG